ncbi:CU044_2847 family protein [Amycolatopsis sp. cmx-4-54]|uniref:CU044_2847 family protein n=1 Tax=Amycolatopsis sp. cmx-4-54 TaxID=2790936 RepID=UPI00397CC168
MNDLARFPLEGGGSVVVEIDPVPGTSRVSRRDDLVEDAKGSFEAALANVKDAAVAALDTFRSMTRGPDEVELKFGVKLTAQAGAVIAKTGLEGNFEVKLKWTRNTEDA